MLGAYPQITRIQGTYPRAAGDILNVYGLNLYSIEDIYFTSATEDELNETEWETVPGTHVAITDYDVVKQDRYLNSNQVYEVASQLALTTPDLPFDEGCLVIECAAGIVYIPYTKVPGKPVITNINTDMPFPGYDLVITADGKAIVHFKPADFGANPEELYGYPINLQAVTFTLQNVKLNTEYTIELHDVLLYYHYTQKTALQNMPEAETTARKFIRGGQLFIEKDGVVYSVTGIRQEP